jgi:hypothetical protein
MGNWGSKLKKKTNHKRKLSLYQRTKIQLELVVEQGYQILKGSIKKIHQIPN